MQRQRERQAADPAADDHDFHACAPAMVTRP
jgi:hypothetical protein